MYICTCVAFRITLSSTCVTASLAGLRAELPAALLPRGPGALRGQRHASGGCHGHRGQRCNGTPGAWHLGLLIEFFQKRVS